MPDPRSGESEQAYVARFMASDEARRDFPDEKQRAAVAYSKFREKKNGSATCNECGRAMTADGKGGWTGHAPGCKTGERANDLFVCPECGAEMSTGADSERIRECAVCGCTQVADATPPVESLSNLCPVCHHAIEPDHDEFGCHVPDCPCAEQRQLAISEPRDVLPNAGERSNGVVSIDKWRGNPRVRFEGQPNGKRVAFVESDGEGVDSSDSAIEREVRAGRTVTIVLTNSERDNATDKDVWKRMTQDQRLPFCQAAGVSETYRHVERWEAIPDAIREKIAWAISGGQR